MRDSLRFKLADWSNTLDTMAVSGNTMIFVSNDGVDDTDSLEESTTLTSTDYSDWLDISNIDADGDASNSRKIVMLDMFYKIPT